MDEIWKSVNGYEGYYEVRNLGRVKRCSKQITRKNRWGGNTELVYKGGILSPSINSRNGYIYVHLSKNGKSKMVRLHRLVASAFVPNEGMYNQINHIDGDKTNNRACNLEWCNSSQNMKHSYGIGLRKAPKAKGVVQYSKDGHVIKHWKNAVSAERELSIHNVTACCRGVRKTAGGYVWRFCGG